MKVLKYRLKTRQKGNFVPVLNSAPCHEGITSALGGGESSASRPGSWYIAPDTHWIRRWIGLKDELDAIEKKKYISLVDTLLNILVQY
jgi:hypothetical protein